MRKYVIMGIGLFLAALFVATIGNMYTGYSTYKTDNNYDLSDFPAPFIKNNVYNGLKIVLPERYSIDELNAANNLAISLQKNKVLPPDVVLPIKYLRFEKLSKWDEENGNLILIGDTCTNPVMQKFADHTSGCTFGLSKGQGYIKLKKYETRYGNTRHIMIISGYSLNDILNAANVISDHESYPIKGNSIIVSGNPISGAKYVRLSYISDGQ